MSCFPFHFLLLCCAPKACELIVERGGASLEQIHSRKNVTLIETVLCNVPSLEGVEVVRTALARGALPHARTASHNETYLHLVSSRAFAASFSCVTTLSQAAARGWKDAIALFLGCASIERNAVDCLGETCLHKAVRLGDPAIVDQLVAAGVDQLVVGQHGLAYQVHRQTHQSTTTNHQPPPSTS